MVFVIKLFVLTRNFIKSVKCIPNTNEKYISFSKNIQVGSFLKYKEEFKIMHEIRFIDSFKFLASSLDNLVSNMP